MRQGILALLFRLAGDGTAGFAASLSTAARFKEPDASAVDAAGNLYVTEHGNHAIRKTTPQGRVTTVAGTRLPGARHGHPSSMAWFHSMGPTFPSPAKDSHVLPPAWIH